MDIWIVSAIIALYLGVIGLLSFRAYRRSKDSGDYLLAGRSAHPFVMAMSYGAAFISTSAIIGFGGMAAKFGLGLLWLPFMNIAVGILIAFLFFGKRTRRIGHELKANTFPELLGLRYQSPHLKWFIALLIVCFMPLYSSAVLVGGARVLEGVMPYDVALIAFAVIVAVYVVMGGLKGVMYVDAMMGVVMVIGMVALLVTTYVKLGGVVDAHQALTDMNNLVPEDLRSKGHAGWTRMPLLGSECWWMLVTSLMLGVGIGALAQPQLAVRFMTVRSGRELNRAVLIGSVFILLTAGIAYVLGAISNVWFFSHDGKIALEAAGGNADAVMPLFIKSAMNPAFYYIFMVTLLSAGMSTLSSLLHVIGSSFGHDLVGNWRPGRNSVGWTRCGIVIGIAFSVLIGYLLPASIIARVTAIFFGICAASFLPSYFAGLYWRGATRAGVWASVIVGALVCGFGLLFTHRAESAALGICVKLFGKTELFGVDPWPFVDPLVFALPASALALIVVSWLTPKLDPAHLERCFGKNNQ